MQMLLTKRVNTDNECSSELIVAIISNHEFVLGQKTGVSNFKICTCPDQVKHKSCKHLISNKTKSTCQMEGRTSQIVLVWHGTSALLANSYDKCIVIIF